MRRNRRLPRLLGTIVLAILLLVISPLVAPVAQARPGSPDSSAGHLVVNYTNDGSSEPPLLNTTEITVEGVQSFSDFGSGCDFQYPDLQLAAGQQMVGAQLVSTDFTSCTEVVQVGTPAYAPTEDSTLDSATQSSATGSTSTTSVKTSAIASPSAATTLRSGSAYFAVRWYDVIGLQVTGTRSNVSWAWDGVCVRSSSGSGSYWWRSGTGWLRYSYGSWIYRYCSTRRSTRMPSTRMAHSAGPVPSGNVNDDVQVRAWYNGTLGGSVRSTYTTYPFACPTLHWRQYLVRVT